MLFMGDNYVGLYQYFHHGINVFSESNDTFNSWWQRKGHSVVRSPTLSLREKVSSFQETSTQSSPGCCYLLLEIRYSVPVRLIQSIGDLHGQSSHGFQLQRYTWVHRINYSIAISMTFLSESICRASTFFWGFLKISFYLLEGERTVYVLWVIVF